MNSIITRRLNKIRCRILVNHNNHNHKRFDMEGKEDRECESCGTKKNLDPHFELCNHCYASSWNDTFCVDEDGQVHLSDYQNDWENY